MLYLIANNIYLYKSQFFLYTETKKKHQMLGLYPSLHAGILKVVSNRFIVKIELILIIAYNMT